MLLVLIQNKTLKKIKQLKTTILPHSLKDFMQKCTLSKMNLAKLNKQIQNRNRICSRFHRKTAAVIQELKNHLAEYNNMVVRQLLECIRVISRDKLRIYFKDGIKTEAQI